MSIWNFLIYLDNTIFKRVSMRIVLSTCQVYREWPCNVVVKKDILDLSTTGLSYLKGNSSVFIRIFLQRFYSSNSSNQSQCGYLWHDGIHLSETWDIFAEWSTNPLVFDSEYQSEKLKLRFFQPALELCFFFQ